MSTVQQKVAAMEKVRRWRLGKQALQTLMRLHVQKYDRHIADVQRELAPFEQRYGLEFCGVFEMWRENVA